MRRSDFVACDCLTMITFSNNLDPDQARQKAASDRSLQGLQDSDIIIVIIIIIIIIIISVNNLAWAVSNLIEENAKFCYILSFCLSKNIIRRKMH